MRPVEKGLPRTEGASFSPELSMNERSRSPHTIFSESSLLSFMLRRLYCRPLPPPRPPLRDPSLPERRVWGERAILYLLAVLVCWFALGAPAAQSETKHKPPDLTELPLEALLEIEVPKVYGVSRVEQKSKEAPASVTVVTADEIKKQGRRTLADVLQSVQGFNVSYDRNYSFLGARGVSLGDNN